MKGGQALSTCSGCYVLKMSCKTGANTAIDREQGQKLEALVRVEEEAGVPEQVDPKDETEEIPGRAHRPPRLVVVQAQACLEKYHKLYASRRDLADINTVPASMLFERKHPTADEQPTIQKHACSGDVEDQMCPANTPTPLFLANPKELSYPAEGGEQPREATQYSPISSVHYSPIIMLNTPVSLVSHGADENSGFPEYETLSEG